MKGLNDLETRGINDVLIAVADELKDMPEALNTVFPATTLQFCIVDLMRNNLDYISRIGRKLLAAALNPIYTAVSAEVALAELDAFERGPRGVKFRTSWPLAPWLGSGDSVLSIPAFSAARDLHY